MNGGAMPLIQVVVDDDAVAGLDEVAHNGAPDISGSAGDEYSHGVISLGFTFTNRASPTDGTAGV
jgi:hypothetical protein